MIEAKKRAVVICPGRGSYTKETLGYLKKHRPAVDEFVADLDGRRKARGELTISELDNAVEFKPGVHTKGENASTLIYACSYADFQAIDREKFEIVAVTGNSMGWYLAMSFAGALDWRGSFEVINTMGSMMKDKIIGGQIIYPVVDGDWRRSRELQETVDAAIAETRNGHGFAYPSIRLGGYAVIGGDSAGLSYLMKTLPKIENYPFQLVNHAAFHTPLLAETSQRAFQELGIELFREPTLPMVDGRGKIWQPYSTDLDDLYDYTLGHQVIETYDFTKAVSVCLKEFAPDHLILLGPGNSLGGSIGQILIENQWHGMKSKSDFTSMQKSAVGESPFLISMGLENGRN